MEVLKIVLKTVPVAKQSTKFNMRTSRAYTPANKRKAKELYTQLIRESLSKGFKMTDKPIRITKLWFIFKAPQRFKAKQKKHIKEGGLIPKLTTPDLDNLQKLLFDSCSGIIWDDDKQIFSIDGMRKYYGLEDRIVMELEY